MIKGNGSLSTASPIAATRTVDAQALDSIVTTPMSVMQKVLFRLKRLAMVIDGAFELGG